MNIALNRIGHKVPILAVVATAALGSVSSQFIDKSFLIPAIAILMILWVFIGLWLRNLRAVVIGLSAFVAACAGSIGAYFVSICWIMLAVFMIFTPLDYNNQRIEK